MAPSGLYTYLTRIIPALSVVGLTCLLCVSLLVAPYGKTVRGQRHGDSTNSQLLLSLYIIVLHVPSVLFPARLCWAIGHVTKKTREAANIVEKPRKRKASTPRKSQVGIAYPSPLFVIIVPAYKETVETLEETLTVLASHVQARHAYHIYLAMEGKEEGSDVKATKLIASFEDGFFRMSFTVHPANIPGEAQGKSSNESWAAKQAFRDYLNQVKKDIIITVMDADTHLSTRYFAQVARYHAEYAETNTETIYVPPLVFDRNVNHVPLPVRTADLIWAGAGISNLYNGSKICIPTSVYSLPMLLAEGVGGWDTGPGAIGEDMHMYLKCFFALSGNLTVRVVYAAASQCNVSSDLSGWPGYWDGLRARYGQALRHMWGAMDTGYAVRQTLSMIRRRYQTCYSSSAVTDLAMSASDAVLAAMSTVCGWNFPGFDTTARSDKSKLGRVTPPQANGTYSKPIHVANVLVLFNNLFEAHFLPVHLALMLTTTTVYDFFAGSLVPHELALALRFSETCRWIGWSLVCAYFFRYEQYHRLCLELREEEMRAAGLLDDHSLPHSTATHAPQQHQARDGFARKLFGRLGFIEACLFPIGGFLFGSIPACQAVLSHVFTDRLTYHVSLKPQFIRAWQQQGRGGDVGNSHASTASPPKPAVKLAPASKKRQATHVRCPSDTWRKQAMAHFDHFTTALAINRPVERKN